MIVTVIKNSDINWGCNQGIQFAISVNQIDYILTKCCLWHYALRPCGQPFGFREDCHRSSDSALRIQHFENMESLINPYLQISSIGMFATWQMINF